MYQQKQRRLEGDDQRDRKMHRAWRLDDFGFVCVEFDRFQSLFPPHAKCTFTHSRHCKMRCENEPELSSRIGVVADRCKEASGPEWRSKTYRHFRGFANEVEETQFSQVA
jgi:hypothetical protein